MNMITKDNMNYKADQGKVLVRKSDDFIMGTGLCLGVEDNIDNYKEIDCPEGYTEGRDDGSEENKRLNRHEQTNRKPRV